MRRARPTSRLEKVLPPECLTVATGAHPGKLINVVATTPYVLPAEDAESLEVPHTSLPVAEDATAEDTSADGRNLGFAVDDIRVLANRDWAEANPAAARFLELVEIDINDVSAQNLLMREGEDSMSDIQNHVDAWIEENADAFEGWVAEARQVE